MNQFCGRQRSSEAQITSAAAAPGQRSHENQTRLAGRPLFGNEMSETMEGGDSIGHRPVMLPPLGATSEETEVALGKVHQSVSPRFKELRIAGLLEYLIVKGEIVKRDTQRGRGANVHVVTPKGRQAANAGIPIRTAGGDITRGRHRGNPRSNEAFARGDYSTLRLDIVKFIAPRS
jgi:hypothetical protein